MSQFSIGEDIIGVLIIVSLISLFLIVWSNSYKTHQEQQLSKKKSNFLLSISDYLQNGSLNQHAEPALIHQEMLENKIPNLLKNYRHEGIGINIEIITRDGETVYSSDQELESPLRSVSLPILYENSDEKSIASLNIRMET